MSAIDRAIGAVSRTANIVGVAMIMAIMVLVCSDVFLRFFFSQPITGAFEIVQLMLVIAVFFGFAYTARTGGHIAVDLLFDAFPPRARHAITFVISLLSLGTFGFMTYALWAVATGPGGGVEMTGRLDIPLQPFKLCAAAGIALMSIEIALQAVRALGAALTGREPGE